MNATPQPLGGGLGFRVGEIVMSAGGAYRVRGFLGRGGMAQVLDVEDEGLGKRFALKILDTHLSSDGPSVERFEREARALAKLDHPHLVAVVRLERTLASVPRPFFLMERLRGGTLRDHLNRGPVSLDRTLTVCSDLLRALDYVHERKLLHRDVKPSNVFVHVDAFGEERAKLLDFGVMKLMLEHEAALGFFGTAHYAAPEQLEPEGILGPPSDVYGAGIVLFETLTGRHPFAQAERTPRGARAARRRGAPSLADHVTYDRIPRDVLDELTPLVGALLARDPLGRPSAGTAARALARIARALASLRAETEDILAARTAVPEPFLPGHLAAPTEVDEPGVRRFPGYVGNANPNHTIPMPPPEGHTHSVSNAELDAAPQRRVPLVPEAPAHATATRMMVDAPPRPSPPPLPPMHPNPGATLTRETEVRLLLTGPNGTERLSADENPVRHLVPPNMPETPRSKPARLSLATKVLFAVALLVFATALGILGKRPRTGSAKATTAHGLAAGTSSPASHVALHAL
jgi:eukaryotic-like serine/threonine-protein kinase